MHCLASVLESFLGSLPSCLYHFDVFKLVEYTIAAENYEVVIVLNFEALYVWRGDNHFWIAAVFGALRLDITKRS